MQKKNVKVEQVEGTYYKEPFNRGGKATLWHYGGYMAYSTKNGDYLSGLRIMQPYVEHESETIVTGYAQRLVKTRVAIPTGNKAYDGVTPQVEFDPTGEWVSQEVPITKSISHKVDVPYVPFGQQIQAGDTVKCAGTSYGRIFGGTKSIEALNDSWVLLDGMYVPWTSNIVLERV